MTGKGLRVLLLVHTELFDPSDPKFSKVTPDTESEHRVLVGLEALGHESFVLPFDPYRKPLRAAAAEIARFAPDIVFNFIVHVDGDRRLAARVPKLLESLRIPYTGASALGIAAIDKAGSKRTVSRVGFPVPPFLEVPVGTTRIPRSKFALPGIVKARFGAASEGLTRKSVVHSQRELMTQARAIHRKLGEPAICEQYIDGRELSVGMVEDVDDVLVLPIRETVFGRAADGGPRFCTERVKDSFAYRDRWGIRYERAVLPAPLDERIRRLCRSAFRALRLSGYARVDLRLSFANDPTFLEANANPDLSPRYFGIMASWMGLTYEDLLAKILQAGLDRS